MISYDVSDNRLRQKVSKELENYGKRVQYSVFECHITAKQLRKLRTKLAAIMEEEEEGNIRIYYICGNCEKRLDTIGIPEEENDQDEDTFII